MQSISLKQLQSAARRLRSMPPAPTVLVDGVKCYEIKPMPGQWWERMGYVLFLPPGVDPNSDPMFQGWVAVTQERARHVLAAQIR